MRVLGLGIAAIVGAVVAINAFFMLVSPQAWFRLPSWILAKGTLTEKRFASGWGAVEKIGRASCRERVLTGV